MPAFNVVRFQQPFASLYQRIYERTHIKMKAYTAVQKKLLILIYTLWKKDEAFEGEYATRQTSKEEEPVPSFASAPQEPITIAPQLSGATQDKHPAKYRRMPSFASGKFIKNSS